MVVSTFEETKNGEKSQVSLLQNLFGVNFLK